jgi:spore maturation protein CgeB
MRILLIGPKWIGGWLEGAERAMHDLGHTITTFRYDTPWSPSVAGNRMRVSSHTPQLLHPLLMPIVERVGRAWEDRMNRRLVKVGRSLKPDLVLILKGETLQEDTLVALQSPGRHIASWWLDDPILYFNSHPQVRSQMPHLDTLFIYDRGKMKELSEYGARRIIYLPCAVDTSVYHPKGILPADLERYRCDVGFAATYYPERGRLLTAMSGLKVSLWGSGWSSSPEIKAFPNGTLHGKKLSGSELAALYGIALICPNVHHSQSLLGGLNLRTFEIPSAGGFQLVDDVPGLEEHFELGREIIVYKSPGHFRELADYYLAHPSERTALIKRGKARVMRDHTYLQRMNVVMGVVTQMA